ncbi:DUF4037 domain-containing protein [Thermocatellispora tengchongensis]|uniref:DUF4037 domain-containing protein n=1 Tax=Thermocatellispora tengchongensis TaxID=1073253 RepID=UPI003640FCAC
MGAAGPGVRAPGRARGDRGGHRPPPAGRLPRPPHRLRLRRRPATPRRARPPRPRLAARPARIRPAGPARHPLDWLAAPWQHLAEITGGEVFHDGLGVLEHARAALRWYPADVWRYVLACQWARIARQESFPGRSGEAGDDLGSAVITARLAGDVMRLALLMRRRYPPYAKWLGTAFTRLPGTAELGDALAAAVAAGEWRQRQRHLAAAYERVAALHNRLALTGPLQTTARPYSTRPFPVIDAGRFAAALLETITDPRVRALAPAGSIDQLCDPAALPGPEARRAVTAAALHP